MVVPWPSRATPTGTISRATQRDGARSVQPCVSRRSFGITKLHSSYLVLRQTGRRRGRDEMSAEPKASGNAAGKCKKQTKAPKRRAESAEAAIWGRFGSAVGRAGEPKQGEHSLCGSLAHRFGARHGSDKGYEGDILLFRWFVLERAFRAHAVIVFLAGFDQAFLRQGNAQHMQWLARGAF